MRLSQRSVVENILFVLCDEEIAPRRAVIASALAILKHWKGPLTIPDLRRVLCSAANPERTKDSQEWERFCDRGFRHLKEKPRRVNLNLSYVRRLLTKELV